MLKEARKVSSDPIQEKLRQNKASFNKDVSSFVNDLIHFKKLMNGWPSKFFKERSRISQPIPADPTTIIGSLAGDFQQLAQRGEAIVQEQLNYSKNRRQKQPKPVITQNPETPTAPATPAPAVPDLSKQLAAWEQKYGDGLIAEGSSKLTRTWTRALNFPGSIGWGNNAKVRRHRMNMLKRATTVYKLLGKLQVKIVAPLSGKDSIKESYEILRTIKNEWDVIEESLQSFKVLTGEQLSKEETKKELEELKNQKEETPKEDKGIEQTQEMAQQLDTEVVALAENAKNDYVSVLKTKIGLDAANALGSIMNDFMKEPGPTKIEIARQVLQQYTALLEGLRAKYGVAGNTLGQIEAAIVAKEQVAPKTASTQIEVVAQDFIKKYVGKARHSILSGDTSDLRLNIFGLAKELRHEVDEFMDLAESRKSLVLQYEEKAKKISTKIHKIMSHMLKLYRLYFRVPKEMQGLV